MLAFLFILFFFFFASKHFSLLRRKTEKSKKSKFSKKQSKQINKPKNKDKLKQQQYKKVKNNQKTTKIKGKKGVLQRDGYKTCFFSKKNLQQLRPKTSDVVEYPSKAKGKRKKERGKTEALNLKGRTLPFRRLTCLKNFRSLFFLIFSTSLFSFSVLSFFLCLRLFFSFFFSF